MKKESVIKHDLAWVDVLRVAACFLVVLAHCCDHYVSGTDEVGFLSGAIWGTFCRMSVPLFMMVSGVLLLPTNLRLTEFYSKRLKRILTPFIFWSIVSPFLFYLFVNNVDVTSPCISPENHTLKATLIAAYTWVFNFDYATIPYWYIYMMFGTYLIVPIISSWLKEATQKELKVVIGIWIVTTFVQYIQLVAPALGYKGNYGSMGLLGECTWNTYTTIHYLSGFLGYMLVAHYLVKYPLSWSVKKSVVISSLIWICGFAITFGGFMYTRFNYPEDFNSLEIIWSFTSPNVVMMTVPIFIIFQKIKFKSSKMLAKKAEATYGVFLIHFVIVHIFYEVVYNNIITHPFLQIFIIAVLSFATSTILIMLLRNIPLFRRLS